MNWINIKYHHFSLYMMPLYTWKILLICFIFIFKIFNSFLDFSYNVAFLITWVNFISSLADSKHYCFIWPYLWSWFFQWSCMDVRVGLWRKLSTEELMLLNYGVEKTLESPLDCKEIQPVHPKGDQSWVFIRSTDAEAETPILWPPHEEIWLIGKDPDTGRDWG